MKGKASRKTLFLRGKTKPACSRSRPEGETKKMNGKKRTKTSNQGSERRGKEARERGQFCPCDAFEDSRKRRREGEEGRARGEEVRPDLLEKEEENNPASPRRRKNFMDAVFF